MVAPDGMTLRENGKSCGYNEDVCGEGNTNPNCETPLAEEPIVPTTPPVTTEEPLTCESGSVFGKR